MFLLSSVIPGASLSTSPIYQDQRSEPQILLIGGKLTYEHRWVNKETSKWDSKDLYSLRRKGNQDIWLSVKGWSKKNSDIDLLVELESGRSLLDIIAIKQDLEDLLGCKVDIVTEGALSPYIRDEILNQAVRLWREIRFISNIFSLLIALCPITYYPLPALRAF